MILMYELLSGDKTGDKGGFCYAHQRKRETYENSQGCIQSRPIIRCLFPCTFLGIFKGVSRPATRQRRQEFYIQRDVSMKNQ